MWLIVVLLFVAVDATTAATHHCCCLLLRRRRVVYYCIGNDLVVIIVAIVIIVVIVVVIIVATTSSFLVGRFCLFPQRGKLPPSPVLVMGYHLRAMMVATAQSSAGRRNMKLREGIILMELMSKMEKIFL